MNTGTVNIGQHWTTWS